MKYGTLKSLPITQPVAATSVGILRGEPLLDLCYEEDSSAEVDMNLVMTGSGRFVELQATAEKTPFDDGQLEQMVGAGAARHRGPVRNPEGGARLETEVPVEAVLRHHQSRQAARVSDGPSRFHPSGALPGLASIAPPEETGVTFEENAVQKALYYSKYCDGYLFVDDSGLEVDALSGAPGVYSARFAGPNATDAANNQLLLDRMRGITEPHSAIRVRRCAGEAGRLVRTFRGEVEGRLLEAPRGANGFGYDPLFFYPPFGSQLWGSASRAQDGSKPSRPSASPSESVHRRHDPDKSLRSGAGG